MSGITTVLRCKITPAAEQKWLHAVFSPSLVLRLDEIAICEYMAARLNSTLASSKRILSCETVLVSLSSTL